MDNPTGSSAVQSEVDGNALAELTCECCLQLYHNDKEFLFESSAPDGRYPKIWDLPCVVRLREATGAAIDSGPFRMAVSHRPASTRSGDGIRFHPSNRSSADSSYAGGLLLGKHEDQSMACSSG